VKAKATKRWTRKSLRSPSPYGRGQTLAAGAGGCPTVDIGAVAAETKKKKCKKKRKD
jgi:hypothetical protein